MRNDYVWFARVKWNCCCLFLWFGFVYFVCVCVCVCVCVTLPMCGHVSVILPVYFESTFDTQKIPCMSIRVYAVMFSARVQAYTHRIFTQNKTHRNCIFLVTSYILRTCSVLYKKKCCHSVIVQARHRVLFTMEKALGVIWIFEIVIRTKVEKTWTDNHCDRLVK